MRPARVCRNSATDELNGGCGENACSALVPSEPPSQEEPDRSLQFGTATEQAAKVTPFAHRQRSHRPKKAPQETFSNEHRMRTIHRRFHTGAANCPVDTTKLLVRETTATNVGTICAQQGISAGAEQGANR
jgi:hypothetical protein